MSEKKPSVDELSLRNALECFQNDDYAATTFLNKYPLRSKSGDFLETHPRKTLSRVMKTLADAMPEEKNIKTQLGMLSGPTEAWLERVFGDEYSPFRSDRQWTWYGIFMEACGMFEGVCPQGSILSAAGNEQFPQSLSNCFVIASPNDSIAGILQTSEQEAQLMKKRGGVGIDISTLRPAGTTVANAARTSTGAAGWMNHFSNVCQSIGQNGRRGALMLSIDVKHPDALHFARAKLDPTYCTGANVSIKITDEFMDAVRAGAKFVQQWPVDSDDPEIVQEIDAKELWDAIIHCAWERAEPGIIMWDTAIKNLPAHCYADFKSICTNPCSEIILSAFDSCRLITMCLIKYVLNAFTDKAEFDFIAFKRDIRIAMRMLDAVVTAEIQHIDKILDKLDRESKLLKVEGERSQFQLEIDLWKRIRKTAVDGRRTGLGTHGLADCLCQLTLRYDSDEAIEMVSKIYETIRDTAYDESVEMAIEYGSFPVFNWDTEKSCAFIKRLPKKLRSKIKKYGRRNISLLTNAPTGTISTLSLCSSGIEPSFRYLHMRRRKINPSDVDTKVDFIDDEGVKWSEHQRISRNMLRYFEVTGQEFPKDARSDKDLEHILPDYFVTSDKINWMKRVELQAAAQQSIDHSISSTINLPSDVTEAEVGSIYEHAYDMGLKGITVYRDGCRDGVLISGDESNSITRVNAPTRPTKLPCEVHFTKVKGEEFIVIVGLLSGSVYEVFFGEYRNQIPKKQFSAFVEKKGKTKYYLTYIEGVDIKQIDINEYFNNKDYAAATRLLSMSLRHGCPLEHIIDQLHKSSPSIVEFGSAMSRILKKYIKIEDIRKSYNKCKSCGSPDIEVKLQEGCVTAVCHECCVIDAKCG